MEKILYDDYGVTPSDFDLEDDEGYIMWDLLDEQLDDMFDNSYENKQYVVTGSLGLWDGRHNGYIDKRFYSIREAITECAYYTESIRVYEEKGHLFVDAYHHDGTNHYEIRELTKKGIDMLDDWYDGNISNVKYATKKIKYFNKYL